MVSNSDLKNLKIGRTLEGGGGGSGGVGGEKHHSARFLRIARNLKPVRLFDRCAGVLVLMSIRKFSFSRPRESKIRV